MLVFKNTQMPDSVFIKFSSKNADILEKLDKKLRKGENEKMKKYIIWNSVVFIFFFGIMSVYLDKIPLVVWMLVGVIIEVLFRIIWGFIEKNDNDNITDKDCENYNKKR